MEKIFISAKNKYKWLVLGFCCMLFFQSKAQSVDYRLIFGDHYQKAVQFVSTHKAQIDSVCKANQVSAQFLVSVVFPELIRYDALFDKMEVGSLETFYVQLGKDYTDFSIGYFQMKPSFIEKLEKDAQLLKGTFVQKKDIIFKLEDNKMNRALRIGRMEKQEWQLAYLVLFYKITEKRFSGLKFNTENEKVRFFATAYNCGYWKKAEEIKKYQSRNFYHLGKFISEKSYNYAEISMYVFQHEAF